MLDNQKQAIISRSAQVVTVTSA